MREVEMTLEEQKSVTDFAGGIALAFYYELQEDDIPIEAVDFGVRYAMEQMGFIEESLDWRHDYFEYLCVLIAIERFGENTITNVSQVISEIIGIAVMSVTNSQHPIHVGVIPNPEDELTVPQEWSNEA